MKQRKLLLQYKLVRKPTAPYEPRPVGIDINKAPTVDSEIASLKPNVKTIGKVISPAIRPTKVSNDATPTLSFGRLLFLFK